MTNLCRDDVLKQIDRIKTEIDSLKSHSQRYARAAKSLSSAALPDHIVNSALEPSRIAIDLLKKDIRAGLENTATDNLGLSDECRVDTQIDFIERRFKGALLEHQLTEARDRRVQTQDRERRQEIEEETAIALGVDRQLLFPMRKTQLSDASAVLNTVDGRSRAVARIEEDMAEINDCFQEFESLVVAQESKVITSEEASGEALNNVEKGNENLDPAIDHAISRKRNRRRLVIIISVILLVLVLVLALPLSIKRNA